METTPNDLRQQQFEIKFRGYNPDDVEVFRDLAAEALEEARAEILKLSEENRHLTQRLEHLVAMEETLKAAVLETQKNAETTIDNARRDAKSTLANAEREAELVIREASHKRDEVITDMHQQMSQLVGDINKIRFIRSNYLTKLKGLISSQLEIVGQAFIEDRGENAPVPAMPDDMPEISNRNDSSEEPAESAPAENPEPTEGESIEDWQELKEKLNEE